MNLKRIKNRFKRDITGKTAKATIKSLGGGGKSKDDKGDAAAPDKGPQFTDAARVQAAGAGTVGFTQQTQNW